MYFTDEKDYIMRMIKEHYANDKRNGENIILFNIWEKVCFC